MQFDQRRLEYNEIETERRQILQAAGAELVALSSLVGLCHEPPGRWQEAAGKHVSAVADPATGVAVYDSYGYQGQKGWFTVGGTSASSPMWAGRAAVAGKVVDSGYVYGANITYRDITTGNNGALCRVGFDLCSGRGSWTGTTP